MSSSSASQSSAKPSNIQHLSSPTLPSSSNGNSSFAIEQRRNVGGGNSGSSIARNNQAAPRNNQSSRKNHKNHRRPNTPRLEINEQAAMSSNSGNRRGTSITHLIDWNIAPRPQLAQDNHIRNYRRNPTWGLGSGYHPVDKARYVNANYRFIVNPDGDYRAQAVDSDVNIPWDTVLQVLASEKSQNTHCPICLSHPVAPRMATCGHIFCLPCLLRYMATVEGENNKKSSVPEKKPKFKKCPICGDSIYMDEVKPVRWFAGQEVAAPREGADIVLRLVMRCHGSTLALPKDGSVSDADEIPWHFVAEVADYARIMKGTTSYMVTSFKQEIEDLEVMQKEDELMFDDEGEWTRKAVAIIYNRVGLLLREPRSALSPPSILHANKPNAEPEQLNERASRFHNSGRSVSDLDYMMDGSHSGQQTPIGSQGVNLIDLPNSSLWPPGSSDSGPPTNSSRDMSGRENTQTGAAYYFYRALPHYYLAPLDIRILKAAFGSYSSFPSTILPRIENISRQTVDEEFRKRAKYLAHLPSGCEVAFLECDWADIVSPKILQTFNSEIEKRRKRKRDKDAREERDKLEAEKEEVEEIWRQGWEPPSGGIGIFPQPPFSEEAPMTVDAVESHPAPARSTGEQAPALTAGPLTTLSNTIPGQMTVWGTPVVQSSPFPVATHQPQDDGWLDMGDMEEDILAHYGLEKYTALSRTPDQSANAVAKGGKKKKKKLTLMTNGGRRGA